MKKLVYLLSTLFFLVSVNANEYIHFYGNESDITEEIVNIADNQYNTVCDLLNLPKNKVINIHIYPDIKTFHNAIDMPFGDWFIIDNVDETIYMVSPLNPGTYHSSNSVKRAMLGSIATSLLYHKCEKRLEAWVHAGFQYYLTVNLLENHLASTTTILHYHLSKLINDRSNFSLDNLSKKSFCESFDNEYKQHPKEAKLSGINQEAINYSCVSFIINKFGYDKFVECAKNNSLDDVFSISKKDFENYWFEYVMNDLLK